MKSFVTHILWAFIACVTLAAPMGSARADTGDSFDLMVVEDSAPLASAEDYNSLVAYLTALAGIGVIEDLDDALTVADYMVGTSGFHPWRILNQVLEKTENVSAYAETIRAARADGYATVSGWISSGRKPHAI